ncbi:MAG: hypothetical protein IJ420_06265 [Lachnospiraceae bacterium]|nr:hypothetical protein [Lachnospiraceae bacterium]
MKKYIFWIIYAVFTIGLIAAGLQAVRYVKTVLMEYELSQPEKVVEKQLEVIREAAAKDALDTVITFQKLDQAEYDIDISDFREYKDKIKNAKELTYKIKNGYSETEQKFNILADGEVVAVLSLESMQEEIKLAILKVNEWQVREITPIITLVNYNYTVEVPKGFSVEINGTKLTDAVASEQAGWEYYVVETLYSEPQIKICDAYGKEAHYDIANNHVKPVVYRFELRLPKEISVYAGGRLQEGTAQGEEKSYSFITLHESLELKDAHGNAVEYKGGDDILTYNYVIKLPDNFKVSVNGQEAAAYITDSYANEKYQYCEEYAKMPGFFTYEINNALCEPAVGILDNLNQKVECVFENGVFELTEQTSLDAIPEEIAAEIDVLEVAKMWSKFMTKDLEGSQKGFGTMKKYLIKNSYLYNVAYKWVTNIDITFVFGHVLKNPPFTDEKVTNFISYGDNLFSCDIYFVKHMEDLKDRNEGEIEDVMNSTFYFMKYDETNDGVDNPKWVILDIAEILSK